jgi:hypothetical protein
MRAPLASGTGQSATAAFANPAVLVILLLLFGATAYLFRQRYIRPGTAYALMTLFAGAIVAVGTLLYTS